MFFFGCSYERTFKNTTKLESSNMKLISKYLAIGFLCFSSHSCTPPIQPDPNWIAQKQKNDEDRRLRDERVSKSVEILSDPAGARIEINGDYVGDAPCTVKVICNGHGDLMEKFEVTALPRYPGHSVQTNWFRYHDKAPARVFFNMSLSRYRPSIDVNIID
jgi:hypothetical protein